MSESTSTRARKVLMSAVCTHPATFCHDEEEFLAGALFTPAEHDSMFKQRGLCAAQVGLKPCCTNQ